jgi:hypothetical protein
MTEKPPPKPHPAAGPAGRVAAVVMASLHVTVEQVGTMLSVMPGATLPPPGIGAANDEDSREDAAARKQAEADPLVAKGKEYATGSLRVMQTLRPRLGRLADKGMTDAAERLEETCITIASKIHRAVSSALVLDAAPDVQGDANGSAKVALLLIEESRQAWRELMQPGRAIGNGAPARFVRLLEVLEKELHERFPRALEFVRPGFDTTDDGVHAEVARAMLGNGSAPVTRN